MQPRSPCDCKIGFASGDVPANSANIIPVGKHHRDRFISGYLGFNLLALTDSLAELCRYADGKLKPHIGHVLQLEMQDAFDNAHAQINRQGRRHAIWPAAWLHPGMFAFKIAAIAALTDRQALKHIQIDFAPEIAGKSATM
jgi:hypothetical protein